MTDPELADATYVEPLTPEFLERIVERERPDAILPTVGGQTAINLALALAEKGVLERRNVDAHRSERAGDAARGGPRPLQEGHARDRRRGAAVRAGPLARRGRGRPEGDRAAGRHPPVLHDGRLRRRGGQDPRGVPPDRPARAVRVPGARGPHRGVRRGLERVRARGHAGHRGQRHHRLLDREFRRDGRAHGRLDHRGAADDPLGPPVPGHARRGQGHHPQGRRRHRRLQHPVRRGPEERPAGRHRDEPAGLALVGPGLQGDRFPDREDRGPPRRRLSPRRDPQRHHEEDAGVLRAVARLRRRQDPALDLREVSARRQPADDPDEVGRRSHGDRPNLPRSAGQGDPVARDRAGRPRRRSRASFRGRSFSRGWRSPRRRGSSTCGARSSRA